MKKLQLLLAFVMLGAAQAVVSMEPEEPRETANQYLRDRGIQVMFGDITNNTDQDIWITAGLDTGNNTIVTIPARTMVNPAYVISNFKIESSRGDTVQMVIRQLFYVNGWSIITNKISEAVSIQPSITFKNGILSELRSPMIWFGDTIRPLLGVSFVSKDQSEQAGVYIISIIFENELLSSSVEVTKFKSILPGLRQFIGQE